MSKKDILSLAKDRIESFFVLAREGHRFKDKMIIFEYYLKSPIHLINYLFGIKNSRNLGGDVYIKNSYGLFFCGNNFSSVFGSSSMCEPEVRRESMIKNGIVLDLGANCGMHTIPFGKMLGNKGRVISIEPDKKNVKLLEKNIILNGLKNVTIVEKGCFSKRGEMTFYIDELGTGGHSLLENNTRKKETIQVDSIDNIMRDLKIKRVDLIKMDVMGVELETFKGAKQTLKKSHPKIVFELLKKEDKNEVYEFLARYNYKIKQITEWNHIAI